jgi:hypothetical protein
VVGTEVVSPEMGPEAVGPGVVGPWPVQERVGSAWHHFGYMGFAP